MALFNIELKTGDTVPLSMYKELEHRLRHLGTSNYKHKLALAATEANLTSLLREVASNSNFNEGFVTYLQDKYELVVPNVGDSSNG